MLLKIIDTVVGAVKGECPYVSKCGPGAGNQHWPNGPDDEANARQLCCTRSYHSCRHYAELNAQAKRQSEQRRIDQQGWPEDIS